MLLAKAIFAACLAPVFTGQQAEPLRVHVSYKTVAALAPKIAAHLAKQAKTQLTIEEPLDREPLIVRLDDVTFKDALDKIASVLHAEWSRQGNGFVISRSDAIEENLRQKSIDGEARKIAEMLKKVVAKQKSRPLNDATVQEIIDNMSIKLRQEDQDPSAIESLMKKSEEYASMTGEQRLADEIIQVLNARQLAAHDYPEHIVLSTHPKPLQQKLEISNDLFLEMIAEQNNWTNAAKRAQEMEGYIFLGSRSQRFLIDPNDARLIVEVYADESSLMLDAYIVNSRNEIYVQTQSYASTYEYNQQEEQQKPDPPKPNPYASLGLKPVKLTPEAQELRQLIVALQEMKITETRDATKRVQDLVSDPVKYDPLSFAPSEVLLGIGDQKSWNVVARLPDNDQIAAGSDKLTTSDPATFLQVREDESEVSITDGWLTIRPKYPEDVEIRRVNRTSLTAYAKSIQAIGWSTLDMEAELLASNEPGVDTGLPSIVAYLLKHNAEAFGGRFKFENDVDVLRFYGTLSPGLRERLMEGKSIAVRELNDRQQEAFSDLVMNPPDADYRGMSPPAVGDQSQFIEMSSEPKMPKYEEEPTEVVAVSNPPDALITAKVSVGPGLKIKYDIQNPDGYESFTMENWAEPMEAAMRARRLQRTPGAENSISYAWADQRDLRFSIQLTESVKLTALLREHKNNLSAWGPVSKLPEDLQKKINDAIAARARWDANRFVGEGMPGMPSDEQEGASSTPPPQ